MKIIRHKVTKLAMFLLEDSEPFQLTESFFECDRVTATDINSHDYEIVDGDGPELPLYWINNCLSFSDGVWSIAIQDSYDSSLESAKNKRREEQERLALDARATRDKLLLDSDWVTVRAVDQNAQDGLGINVPQVWLDYRQSLRDISSQAGFPNSINWPAKPE